MKTIQNKPIFSTDNFALAIFLKTKGCILLRINKLVIRHALFEFENSTEREKLTRDYWEGQALVEPRAFFATQKELKAFLYDNSYPTE